MVLRAQFVQPLFGSGSGRHVANTIHWLVPDPYTSAHLDEIADRIAAAYAEVSSIRSQCSSPGQLLIYDLNDPEPRLPVYDEPCAAPVNATGNYLPGQVAGVLSYRGEYASGVNRARRRGRLYIGPLHHLAMSSTGSPNASLITETAQGQLLDFATALATPIGAAPVFWTQYSTTSSVPSIVVEASADRSADVQRSRKAVGTRATRAISQPT